MTRVLVPTDGSEMSENALEYAIEEHPDATLHLLHAADFGDTGYAVTPGDPTPASSEEWYQAAEEQAEAILEAAREHAEDRGVAAETEMEVGEPARAIVEAAEREEVDHVVIGSHGREGLSRILLGSVAEKVVRRSPVPVTVVRQRMYEAVPGLLADDGSVRVTALPHGSVDTFYRVAGPGGRVASREEFADHVAGGAEGATVAPRRCAPGGHAVNTALQGHALADDVRLVGHLSRFPLPFEAAQ